MRMACVGPVVPISAVLEGHPGRQHRVLIPDMTHTN
jgi:hypothetical protein